jgi:hypothetical protein
MRATLKTAADPSIGDLLRAIADPDRAFDDLHISIDRQFRPIHERFRPNLDLFLSNEDLDRPIADRVALKLVVEPNLDVTSLFVLVVDPNVQDL